MGSGLAEKGTAYYLFFEDINEKTHSFMIPKDIYDTAVEDTSGTLIYKGTDFISFDGISQGTKIKKEENMNQFVGLSEKF